MVQQIRESMNPSGLILGILCMSAFLHFCISEMHAYTPGTVAGLPAGLLDIYTVNAQESLVYVL